jgi:hypothetical protein
MKGDVTGRVHLDLETNDKATVLNSLEAQLESAVPVRIDLTRRDGRYQLCVRELSMTEPPIT